MSSSVAEREQVEVVGGPVATVEAMEALDVGAEVQLRHGTNVERWSRIEQGWVRVMENGTATPQGERIPLQTRFFSGALTSGLVRAVGQQQFVPLFVGEWLRVDVSTFQVLGEATDGALIAARYRNGTWMETLTVDEAMLRAWMREFRYERGIAQPDYALDRVMLWRTWLHGYRHDATPSEPQTVEVIPPEFVAALQEYAADADDEALDNILDRAGVGRQVRYDVTVVVTGYSDLQVDIPFAARELGMDTGEILDLSESSRVRWRRTFTVSRSGAPGECVCDQVSAEDADVDEHLPGDHEEFEITSLDCPN